MRRTTSIGIVMSVTFLAIAAAPAAALDGQTNRQVVKKSHRQLHDVVQTDAVPQKTCSWVGPGGRAIYMCR
jgi:hypothetical protein